jgi:hypothetical protein
MNIQDALKETGRSYDSANKDSYYVEEGKDGILYWYTLNGTKERAVSLDHIHASWWQPYRPIEEIRPSESGELWSHPNGNYFMTYHAGDELYCRNKHGIESLIADCLNLDKWKRLCPPVNDGEVIVIEGVTWQLQGQLTGIMPHGKYPGDEGWTDLLDKPPMTMTLTIPKEKANG